MFYLYLIRTEIHILYQESLWPRTEKQFCLKLYILYLKALYTVVFFKKKKKKSILYAITHIILFVCKECVCMCMSDMSIMHDCVKAFNLLRHCNVL